MGQSTNAYLFYGYCWSEYAADIGEDDYDDEDDREDGGEESEPRGALITYMDDWIKRVLVDRGHVDPWDSHDDTEGWLDRNERIVDAWNDLKKGVESEIGVEWGRHCSGEYPMPFLCIPESKKSAYRGDREPVTVLAVGEGWDALLAAHMEAQGAPIPEGENQPGWWLVSYWG